MESSPQHRLPFPIELQGRAKAAALTTSTCISICTPIRAREAFKVPWRLEGKAQAQAPVLWMLQYMVEVCPSSTMYCSRLSDYTWSPPSWLLQRKSMREPFLLS